MGQATFPLPMIYCTASVQLLWGARLALGPIQSLGAIGLETLEGGLDIIGDIGDRDGWESIRDVVGLLVGLAPDAREVFFRDFSAALLPHMEVINNENSQIMGHLGSGDRIMKQQ